MSDGPLGPGQCVDTAVKGISDLLFSTTELFNTNKFLNPQAVNILNMRSSSGDLFQRSEAYRAALGAIVPAPPDLALKLQQIDDLQTQIDAYETAVEQYEIWTNFISGKSNVFPASNLDLQVLFPAGRPPGFDVGWPLLAGVGFAGVLGMVKGGNQAAYSKCELDPNDPCAKVNKVIGAIAGVFNTVIGAIITGFNAMTDFAASILDYIAQVLAAVETVIAIVANAVAELANMVLKAIHDGMARLFQALKLDPCISVALQNIVTPDLSAAIGFNQP